MRHALIIDDNRIVSRAIQHFLEPLGFRSFDHSWTGRQAFEAAGKRTPDMIVIGDDTVGAALEAARTIAADGAIPVLMVSGNPARAAARSGEAAAVAGPFTLGEIDKAVDIALGRGSPDKCMRQELCAADAG
jgi:CheY-like chemotaxis protein